MSMFLCVLEHGQQPKSVHISVRWNQWICKTAPLHKFAETWLTICEMQFIRRYFYTIPSFLDESYSRVKMKGTYIDMRTCLRYIKRSTWVHPHQEHPVGSNLGQLTMRIMWKLNPKIQFRKNFEPFGLFTKPRLLRSELSQVIPGMSVKF